LPGVSEGAADVEVSEALHPAGHTAAAVNGFLPAPAPVEEVVPGLLVGRQIGAGRRCLVFSARWQGADVVVKRYKPEAIRKHARLADLPLAEFEYRRNQACFLVPGLARHVARPFAYHVAPGAQWLVQQRIDGNLCSESCADWTPAQWRNLRETLRELVALAHGAGLHDLDLHPGNIMLTPIGGSAEPVLFDFNLVPFTERHRPTLDGWLYRFGLIDPGFRDRRRLRKRFR
jgi:tRNA A-37 threonylcarbamoyl transferase component Bud32